MTQKARRKPGRYAKVTDWDEWPAMLGRMESLVVSGMDGRDARLLVEKEFCIESGVLRDAVKRGDVPFIPSPNQARVQARLRGETLYHGNACVNCSTHERWVSSDLCLECGRVSDRAHAARRKLSSNA